MSVVFFQEERRVGVEEVLRRARAVVSVVVGAMVICNV
jgi:hypothetical protein